MMTFDKFCDAHFLSVLDRQAFKQWLGDTASTLMSERSWLKWFVRWMKERQ